ncbi:MAG TPA: cell division protein ZapA [Flavobacteriales bacterium]
MSEEISIKVTIAGRTYPLKVRSEEEAGIRSAEQSLEESIQLFQKSYAVKDKQDLLAMAALQVTARKEAKKEVERVVERVVETVEVPVDLSKELLQLEQQLDAFLQD